MLANPAVAWIMRGEDVHERGQFHELLVVLVEIAAGRSENKSGGVGSSSFTRRPVLQTQFGDRVFVANTPHDHRRAVLVPHNRGPGAGSKALPGKDGSLRFVVAETERHFAHDVEAHFVTQLDEPRMRRIMRSADEVDVRVAHQFQVAAHEFLRGDAPFVWPDVMVIHTAQFDGRRSV